MHEGDYQTAPILFRSLNQQCNFMARVRFHLSSATIVVAIVRASAAVSLAARGVQRTARARQRLG